MSVIGIIILVVGIFLLKCYSEWENSKDDTPGDFYCPKCGGKWGVERSAGSMIGTTDPWHRFQCKKCGFKW